MLLAAWCVTLCVALPLTAQSPVSPASPVSPPGPVSPPSLFEEGLVPDSLFELRARQGWSSLSGTRVTAWYRGTDSLRAARAITALDRMRPLPALSEEGFVAELWVAPDRAVMDSLVGGRVPEWGAAVALPSQGVIVIPGRGTWPATPVEEVRILRHEWAHVVLGHELGRLRSPRWFTEGYAEWASGSWAGGGAWKLRVAIALGRAPDLDSLVLNWPRQRQPAEVAYLLSASVLAYLVESSGEAGLEALLREWKSTGNFDSALYSVYGATRPQLESDWRKHVKRRYGWLMVMSHSAVFWAILTGGVVFMGFFRRRDTREAMGRLRAGEPPDSPAYWTAEESLDPTPHTEIPTAPGSQSPDED